MPEALPPIPHTSSIRTVHIQHRKKLFAILQFLAHMTEAEGPSENQETHYTALTTDFSDSIGCYNKSARFNFVINAPFCNNRSIYSKSADIFISVCSTHTDINCGTQYPTNVPHNSAETWGKTMREL
jgi:hypothetical protein